MMEATTESDGISEVSNIFLSESERIMTFGNTIRARVAKNPVLAERVAQLQSLTLPPSPPRSKHDSGAEGDDEEEAIDDGQGEGGSEDDVLDDVFVHANVTPPTSQDNNESFNNEIFECKFPGYGNLFIACTCISNVSQMSDFSAETPEVAEEKDVEGTDDESVKYIGNFQGKPREIKIETSSDDSLKCTKHVIHRRRPTMTGAGAYDDLVQKTKADDVTNALKRPKAAKATEGPSTSQSSGAMRSPPASKWQAKTVRRRRQAAGPKTSSPKQKVIPEMHKNTPSGPTPHSPQPSTSRGRRGRALFATAARQNEEIEAGLENFKDPAPEREPRDLGPYLMGDETGIPYASDSSDYIDRDSFCTRKGSKVHPPRRKRKDRKNN
jgi:hypothetical protein